METEQMNVDVRKVVHFYALRKCLMKEETIPQNDVKA